MARLEKTILDNLTELKAIMPLYGEDGTDIPIRRRVFAEALKEFPVEKVEVAFRQWKRIGKRFPCPADIVEIISPPKKYDGRVYSELVRQRRQGFISDQERNYIKDYERFILGLS